MESRTLHALEFTVAIIGQTLLLAAGWGFLGTVFVQNPLTAPDRLADFIYSKPTVTTWIVTLVATVVSVATATYGLIEVSQGVSFSIICVTQLPIDRFQGSIATSGGIALTRNSFVINFRYLIPTFMTLAVFGLTKLLVSSWTALLTPTPVIWSVDASGWELDLTSTWFESALQQELAKSGVALVRGNSTEIFNLDGVLSGIAAAQYSFGYPGIFNFNGVKYNISTGGVLPAVPGYNGTTELVSNNNTGLAFAGGQVPTHLHVDFTEGQTTQGQSQNVTLQQQGLTANVTCRRSNSTADSLNYRSSFQSDTYSPCDGTIDYWVWVWNITGDCRSVPLSSSTNWSLLGTFHVLTLAVVMNASWRYGFLPLTVCEINPLVTISLVSYSNGVINTSVISSESLDSSNSNLTQLLAAIVNHQSVTTQGLTTNAIGDALYAIYVSASGKNSISAEELIDILLRELVSFPHLTYYQIERQVRIQEQYWRGSLSSLEHVPTRGSDRGTDASRDNHDTKDNLDDWLAGFERGGIGRNEKLRVQVTNVAAYHKRFKVINGLD
ncbi:hypothetical protein L210DRAFT_3669836 [Boletus edulis BED1]|uniref:Transmembrane protein n=1 Tax=Boletus edulis BED1 TaxID=1328754 RepID=A0AAD4GG34_BOLED|nr:hypothetical protein L210DRAFT_3669836 [Boletus edulis BED1]